MTGGGCAMVVGRPWRSPDFGKHLLVVCLRCGGGVSYSSVPGVWLWEGWLALLRCQLAVVALVRWPRVGECVADTVVEHW